MIYVNDALCDGCGECAEVCPTGALIVQNNRAFIDQELCEACEVCVDSCPQSAILVGEPQPTRPEIIRVPAAPETASASLAEHVNQPRQTPVREMILPAIGSMLLWTGRELVPRLADLALGALDQRIQRSQSSPRQTPGRRQNRRASRSTRRGKGGRGRGRQRRRRRSNK